MANERDCSRRDILRGGALLPLAAAVPALAAPRGAARGAGAAGPRNVVFMVADGMSAGVPSLAEPFSRLVRGRGTRWRALADHGDTARGYLETESLDSMVTDSAASSSAWGCGERVNNGAINTRPDGTALTPIARLAREAGRRVGLVTTTTVTHATPAGFAAVHADREQQADLAPQYADAVDVAFGGGVEHFEAATRPDGQDLLGAYAQRGYAVCRSREDLLALGARRRALGVFGTGHLPFTIDQQDDPRARAAVPTLREMTRAALACLGDAGRGFLLQVEGGRVDHAAHNNDAAALLWDQLAFDDAIEEVLAFAARDPRTLVVITTDHGNANPGLNGMGLGYQESTPAFARLAGITASFAAMYGALGADGADLTPRPVESVVEIVRAHTGLDITGPEAEAVALTRAGQVTDDLNGQHTGFVGTLGQVLGRYTGIAFTGTTHTNELALTLAVGPGRERFAGVMHHTDVFPILREAVGENR